MHLIKEPFTQTDRVRVFVYYSVPSEMQETTKKDVVPMPGLVWRCKFTFLKGKEEDLVLVFTIAVANLAKRRS